jgi:hypothetical protein
MKYKVLLGSVRTDSGIFSVGKEVELSEKDAKELIRQGIVEASVEVLPEPENDESVKANPPEKKTEEVKKEEPKNEEKVEVVPAMDWTVKEILDYGQKLNVPELEGKSKREMLGAIEAFQKGGEEK